MSTKIVFAKAVVGCSMHCFDIIAHIANGIIASAFGMATCIASITANIGLEKFDTRIQAKRLAAKVWHMQKNQE